MQTAQLLLMIYKPAACTNAVLEQTALLHTLIVRTTLYCRKQHCEVLSVPKEDTLVGQGSILQRDNDPEQEEKKEMLAAHDGGAAQSPGFNPINFLMNEESEKQSKLQSATH